MDVRAEQRIARPAGEVAAFAMDPARETRWIKGISETRQLTPGPVGKGTRVARVAHFLGKRIDYTLEVREHEPGRRVVMESVEGPFDMTVTYEFEPLGKETLARIRLGGDPGGPAFLVAWMARRGIARDLRTLKGLLEGNKPADNA